MFKIAGRRVPTSADIEAAKAAAAAADYYRTQAVAAGSSAPSSPVLAKIRARTAQLPACALLQGAPTMQHAFPAPPPPAGALLEQGSTESTTDELDEVSSSSACSTHDWPAPGPIAEPPRPTGFVNVDRGKRARERRERRMHQHSVGEANKSGG